MNGGGRRRTPEEKTVELEQSELDAVYLKTVQGNCERKPDKQWQKGFSSWMTIQKWWNCFK